jgi:oligosaccharyltransferase complex subunit beta
VTVVLSGDPTTYTADLKRPDAPSGPAGAAAALVSAVQARNNARVLVSGSLDLFSDELFDAAVEVADTGKR